MKRSMRRLADDRGGATAIEFALLAPVLLMLAVGLAQFGLVLNNYIMLTDAVRNGARQLALSRAGSTPYTSTVNQVKNSAASLTAANITLTMSVNGTACTTDSGCTTALNTASGQAGAVTATYPCTLVVMGINFVPSCSLSSSTTEMIE